MQTQQDSTSIQKAQPLVTFIVTCYNLPVQMLCECIESILRLSLRPTEREVIVVDDGSEKSPLEELMRYGNEVVYLRKNNGGVSTARNMGLRTATGKYIQFVDGDDTLIQPTYEHCLDIARNGQADLVMFDFTHKSSDNLTYEDWKPISGCDMMRQHNIQGAACLYLFNRSILGELTFTPGISYGEDEEFIPQLLLRAEQVVRTSAKAYFYRLRETSAIGNKTKEGIMKRLDDNLSVIRSLQQKAATLPTAERIALERRVAQLTMDHIYNTITLTRDSSLLHQRLDTLRNDGLFPLPDRNYTTKYKWFRRLTNSNAGLALLMRTLPLMTQER
jgi:glycosyltransferase involved in cell wall biosynthesis